MLVCKSRSTRIFKIGDNEIYIMTGNCEIPCAFEMHTLTVIATRLLYDKKLPYLISCVAHFIL